MSFLTQDTVRGATGLSRSAITHARTWLVRNGWLEKVGIHPGYNTYLVREYRCTVPPRDLEKELEDEFSLGIPERTLGTEKPKPPSPLGTQKPKVQARRCLSLRHVDAADVYDFDVDDFEGHKVKSNEGMNEGINETELATLVPAWEPQQKETNIDQEITTPYLNQFLDELSMPNGDTFRKGTMDDIRDVVLLWHQLTGHYQDTPDTHEAIVKHTSDAGFLVSDLMEYMPIIVKELPKTAKIAWRDLSFFMAKFEKNKRQVDAWRRWKEAKAK